ncbi:MAG: glycosyltransferase [Candidatus Brocadia sp.]|nr:MAG: glycosyltransferase [Candidatus Brocadia sp.]
MMDKERQAALNNNRPTLSACMIVKNEEKFLSQCLTSIKGAVDEIIIVDTGSTDKTVEIAHSFGANIYRHPWNNSFSEARNHSLKYAKGDWILQIDADEILEQADIPLLHKFINNASYNVIFVAIYNELPGGCAKHYFQRIFRRGKAHFEGIVHNQLIFEGKALQAEIRFYHYGYNLSEQDMQKKYKRSGDLLRQQLAENPDNLFVMANLVRNYRNEYDFDKVIALAENGLKISTSQTDLVSKNQRQRLSIDLAHALLNKNLIDKAELVCKKALTENSDSFDILLVLGEVFMKKGVYNDALPCFKKYLILKERENKEPTFFLLSSDFYQYEHTVYNHIGECYKHLGQIHAAIVAYKKAIKLNNKNPLYYSNLIDLYLSQDRLSDAKDLAFATTKSGIANHLIYLLLGKIYAIEGKINDAIDACKQSIRIDSSNIPAHVYLINLLIEVHHLDEASETLKSMLSLYPEEFIFLCLLERIKYRKGNRESPLCFVRNILQSDPPDHHIYLQLGDLCMEMEQYTTAIGVLEKYLKKTSNADAKVIANIAVCYAKQGKLNPALFGFQAALKLDPNCRCALQNLATLQTNA